MKEVATSDSVAIFDVDERAYPANYVFVAPEAMLYCCVFVRYNRVGGPNRKFKGPSD